MPYGDPKLNALYRLAQHVDGAALVRVQQAIRERRRQLELADDPFGDSDWRRPGWRPRDRLLERTPG